MNEKSFLSMKEASELTGYKPWTLYGYASRRIIPSAKFRGRLVFPKAELLEWINQQTQTRSVA